MLAGFVEPVYNFGAGESDNADDLIPDIEFSDNEEENKISITVVDDDGLNLDDLDEMEPVDDIDELSESMEKANFD